MVEVRKDTKLDFPKFFQEEKRVRNLLQMFQRMMFKQRGVSMHSVLEDRRRIVMMMG